MGSFAAMDDKAKPNGAKSSSKANGHVELSDGQKATLAKITDKTKRERLRHKMIENKRRELAASSKPAEDTTSGDADNASDGTATVTVEPAQQTVDVKAPAFTVNLPQTNVSIHHTGLTWGQIGGRALAWTQTFIVGAAAWALFGDGVLRAFGH